MTRRVDSTALEAEIARLDDLPFIDLLQLYQKHHKLAPPKRIGRRLLIFAIAYELQRKTYGLRVDRLRKRILAVSPARKVRDADPESKTPTPRKKVQPGGRLIREWRGRQYEVYVADEGYYLDGRRFRSLSAAAEAITGIKRIGPAFFGLRSAWVGAR